MNNRKVQWFAIAFAVFLSLGVALFVASRSGTSVIGTQARERIAIDSRYDSYNYNSADMYWYSDDHSTQKALIDGAAGNVDFEGTGNIAGALTLQSTASVASELTASNGITVGGSITVK